MRERFADLSGLPALMKMKTKKRRKRKSLPVTP
jgi:hypothetical protein